MKIEEKTEELLKPIIENMNTIPDEEGNCHSYEIVDVEYVKEGSDWYLRAYVDKEDGIKINDCEAISRALEAELDRADFIADAYILEVSSPGLTRALKKERDYERNKDKPVEVHTYKPIDKCKEFIGDLKGWDDEKVILDVGEKEEELIEIPKKSISVIKQYFEW